MKQITCDILYLVGGIDMNYCSNCGEKLAEGADVCLKCGKMVNNKGVNLRTDIPEGRRSKVVAALLAFFL